MSRGSRMTTSLNPLARKGIQWTLDILNGGYAHPLCCSLLLPFIVLRRLLVCKSAPIEVCPAVEPVVFLLPLMAMNDLRLTSDRGSSSISWPPINPPGTGLRINFSLNVGYEPVAIAPQDI